MEPTVPNLIPGEVPRHLAWPSHQAGPMPTSASTRSTTTDDLVVRFLAGTLPRADWTHPAHLLVCRHLLAAASPAEVLAELRVRIPEHNQRVGLLPHHGGYHETITQYFVGAVAATAATTEAELLAASACRRDAPLRHWSPERLDSDEARRAWVEPDLAPLPWVPLA